MRKLLQLISWAALLGTVTPPALYLAGIMDLPQVKLAMLVSTIAWFASTPFWMGRTIDEPGVQDSPASP